MNESAERQVVVFTVGEDQFAVDILDIREIARFQPLRRIPRAPDFLAGVIDLRGDEIVPIIDMHDRLDLQATVEERKSRIIVAPIDGRPVGFLVDVVRDVITIPSQEVEAPPAVGSTPGFLEGVIRVDEEIILLVDVGHILSSNEKLHMEELRRSLIRDKQAAKKPAAKPGKSAESAAPKKSGGAKSGSKSGTKSGSKSGAKSDGKSGAKKAAGGGKKAPAKSGKGGKAS